MKSRVRFDIAGSFIFSIVISLTVSLAILELLLRHIDYPNHRCVAGENTSQSHLIEFDKILGWSNVPNSSSIQENVEYTISDLGIRSDSLNTDINTNKPIILIVGDSFLFGHKVSYEKTLGHLLHNINDNEYEILNFSVNAYGTDQIYLRLKTLTEIYKPKFIITDYLDDHLARNTSIDRRDDIAPCSNHLGTKPQFTVNNDGSLNQIHTPQRFSMYDNPRIVLLLKKFIHTTFYKYNDIEITRKLFREIEQTAESANSELIVFNFSKQDDIKHLTKKSQIINLPLEKNEKKYAKFYINPDDIHPNSLANLEMYRLLSENIDL